MYVQKIQKSSASPGDSEPNPSESQHPLDRHIYCNDEGLPVGMGATS